MPRTYPRQQSCPIARGLEVVGDKWTLLVIRDLNRGHSKYADLLNSLAGISPSVLSDRLQHLELDGVVRTSHYSSHPPRAEYLLTDKGLALVPVLRALSEWGDEWVPRAPRAPLATTAVEA